MQSSNLIAEGNGGGAYGVEKGLEYGGVFGGEKKGLILV